MVSLARIGNCRPPAPISASNRRAWAINTLPDHDAEFAQQPAHLIDQRRPLGDGQGAGAMHGKNGLRFFRLDRYEAHVRAAHRFADRLRIIGVVLAALAVGRNELGGLQASVMAQLDQFSRSEMRTGTGFDADQANWRIREEIEHFATGEGFLQHGLPVLIHAMDLENRLGNIKTDANDFHGKPP